MLAYTPYCLQMSVPLGKLTLRLSAPEEGPVDFLPLNGQKLEETVEAFRCLENEDPGGLEEHPAVATT